MSDLKPHGISVTIAGEEVKILFSIGAIDEVQSECNLGIFDVMEKILQASHMILKHDVVQTFATTLSVIVNYNNVDFQTTTEDILDAVLLDEYPALASAMLDAFGISMPEKDEDEDDDDDEDRIKKKRKA